MIVHPKVRQSDQHRSPSTPYEPTPKWRKTKRRERYERDLTGKQRAKRGRTVAVKLRKQVIR